jgi:hypothetical protein
VFLAPNPAGQGLPRVAPEFALLFRFGSIHVGPSWVHYFHGPHDEDRTIEGTLWTAPAAER